jgi:hypothetical protein
LFSGAQGCPELVAVGDVFERTVNMTVGTLRANAIAECEKRFAEVVKNRQPGDGQIVLFTSTLGQPPGSIIAVEVVDSIPQERKLQWAWSDGTIRVF